MKNSNEFPTEVLDSFFDVFLHCLLVLLHLPQLLHDDSQLGLDFRENRGAPFSHDLNLKILKDESRTSFSSYILSLDASVRSKLTCKAWFLEASLVA